MTKYQIFISSVQKEFSEERRTLKDYIQGDALLSRFFNVFLFEDIPAVNRHADEVYSEEVKKSDIYLGVFGQQYGIEDNKGISATHKEFDLATQFNKTRFIFVKGATDADKQPKMRALIHLAGNQVIRRRFATSAELMGAIYASLVQYLEDREMIRTGPFDAAFCRNASLADLDEEKIQKFLRHARKARGFPLPEDAESIEVLTHLNLLNNGRPTHAAILLFCNKPQRFLISSEIKCAHFHGVEVAKPIPSYQVYKGTVFELVDQAEDFILSKINLAVGTREHSVQVPVEYEMPKEVVREAIVNAVAHRDYTSNGSAQVMLFSDRLEVWNPGALPPSLTLEKLRYPHGSLPGNPLLAEPLYLTKYIERMGTGIRDMIERCRNAGLAEPEFKLTDGFVTIIRRRPGRAFEAVGGQIANTRVEPLTQSLTQSNDPVTRLLVILEQTALSSGEIRRVLGISHRQNFRENYLHPALKSGLVEMTLPDKPNSRLQKYRITAKGRQILRAKGTYR